MNPLKIINYIRENKLTKTDFCKKCNIDISLLDGIIYYGKSIDYSITERIASVMGIGVYELFIFD